MNCESCSFHGHLETSRRTYSPTHPSKSDTHRGLFAVDYLALVRSSRALQFRTDFSRCSISLKNDAQRVVVFTFLAKVFDNGMIVKLSETNMNSESP